MYILGHLSPGRDVIMAKLTMSETVDLVDLADSVAMLIQKMEEKKENRSWYKFDTTIGVLTGIALGTGNIPGALVFLGIEGVSQILRRFR